MKWLKSIAWVLICGLLLLLSMMAGAIALAGGRESDVLAYAITNAAQLEQVMVIDTATRIQLNMTPPQHSASKPVWSPDGEWIIFRASTGPRTDARYFATRLDRRESLWLNMPVELSNFPVLYFEPKWLPDNQQLVFASHNSQGSLQYYRSDITSGRLTRLEKDDPDTLYYEEVNSALISPDGLKSFLIEYHNAQRLLTLSIIEGEEIRRLYSFEGQRSTQFLLPRWAPDSYHIAASLWVDEVLQVYVLDISSTPPRRITYTGGMNPVWRPRN